MSYLIVDDNLQDRIARAVEKVRDHLNRATAAPERHGIPARWSAATDRIVPR